MRNHRRPNPIRPRTSPLLVAHLPLDGNANDTSTTGANHNGTLQGNPTYTPDRFDKKQALLLDGIDDYLILANPTTDLDINHLYANPPSLFTINLWFKIPPAETGTLLSKATDIIGTGVQYIIEAGLGSPTKLSAACQWRRVTSANAITDNQWHMATYVSYYDIKLNQNRWTLYLDGIHQGFTGDVAVNAPGIDTLLGARRNGSNALTTDYLQGALDDFRFYNSTLTSQQIMDLYLLIPPPDGTIISIK